MMRNKKIRRVIAVFLLLNMVNTIVYPTYSWALTAGPTAPEFSGFEPVDTTDMVNLSSGDFTYNLPLIEVPGPAGGYSMSLSNHAGIRPGQEASWVGLGWTLNPGSINRMVNGFADDNNGVSNFDRTFWEGGEMVQTSVGVSYGFEGGPTVSAGITWANDTYQGFGMGGYVGAGFGFGLDGGGSLGANVRVGVSPYGGAYASGGVSLGVSQGVGKALKVSGGLGLNISTNGGVSAGMGASVSTQGQKKKDATNEVRDPKTNRVIERHQEGQSGKNSVSLVGGSLSSSSPKGSLSVGGGAASVSNDNFGKISRATKGWSFSIPTPIYGLSVSASRQYVRYWIDETANIPTYGALFQPQNYNAFKALNESSAYDTYDLSEKDDYLGAVKENHLKMGGSLVDYDQYFVSGQGLSGNIRPYHFKQNVYRQKLREWDEENENYIVHATNNKSEHAGRASKPVEFRFVNEFSNRHLSEAESMTKETGIMGDEQWGVALDNSVITGESGDDGFKDNRLYGTKHVEWFSNKEMQEQLSSGNAMKVIDPNAKGFRRGSTGKVGDQIGAFRITNESGVTYHYSLPVYSFSEFQKTEKKDVSEGQTFQSLSRPTKYAYAWLLTGITGPDYVDRGAVGLDESDWGYWVAYDYGKWDDDYKWRNPYKGWNEDIDSEYKNYSSGKKEIYYLDAVRTATHTALFQKSIRADGKGVLSSTIGGFGFTETTVATDLEGEDDGTILEYESFTHYNVSSAGMKLDRVLLFTNDMLSSVGTINQLREATDDYQMVLTEVGFNPINQHYGHNVVDVKDVDSYFDAQTQENSLLSKALKVVEFDYDYSLMPKTPNSFDPNGQLYGVPNPSQALVDNKLGKLTLRSVDFQGKGGAKIMPPIRFGYNAQSPVDNPEYNEDLYDLWGVYKSDYVAGDGNQNVRRFTTPESGANADAWSLREIVASTGAKIRVAYESDDYSRSVLTKSASMIIDSFEQLSGDEIKLVLRTDDAKLEDLISLNEEVDILALFNYSIDGEEESIIESDCPGVFSLYGSETYDTERTGDIVTVTEIGQDYVKLNATTFLDKVFISYTEPCGNTTITKTPDFIGGNLI